MPRPRVLPAQQLPRRRVSCRRRAGAPFPPSSCASSIAQRARSSARETSSVTLGQGEIIATARSSTPTAQARSEPMFRELLRRPRPAPSSGPSGGATASCAIVLRSPRSWSSTNAGDTGHGVDTHRRHLRPCLGCARARGGSGRPGATAPRGIAHRRRSRGWRSVVIPFLGGTPSAGRRPSDPLPFVAGQDSTECAGRGRR
jgi:hypothetical protein